MVVLTRQRILSVPFHEKIEGRVIEAVNTNRYLGILLDAKLTFWAHIRRAAEKAETMVAMLSQLMPNVADPRSSKRRIIISVAHSIMLYRAELWADALATEKYRKKIAAVQRRVALRITCVYRTVAADAVLVVAGIPPIDVLAKERWRAYQRRAEADRNTVREEERRRTLQD